MPAPLSAHPCLLSVSSGPWSSLEDSHKGRLKAALTKADVNPQLQGWRAHEVRERMDAFIERGLPAYFAHLASALDRVIVHADFGEDFHDASSAQLVAETQA